MDLSVNFDFFLVFKIDIQIHAQTLLFFLYFKLYNSKFARDFKNTQSKNPNTKKTENPNPDQNLWVFLGANVSCNRMIVV